MKVLNAIMATLLLAAITACGSADDDYDDMDDMDEKQGDYEVMAHNYTDSNNEGDDMSENKGIYQFKAETLDGDEKSLSEYSGKVLLIVNTASECGFTPQYEGLQELYSQYKDQGLEVLGFPCNQFGGQEPGSSKDIANFCQANYGVTFPMFNKVDVNGDDSHPLFNYLKSQQSGLITDAIKWNFTKFLVDKNGKPVERYAPQTKPSEISEDIEKLLKA